VCTCHLCCLLRIILMCRSTTSGRFHLIISQIRIISTGCRVPDFEGFRSVHSSFNFQVARFPKDSGSFGHLEVEMDKTKCCRNIYRGVDLNRMKFCSCTCEFFVHMTNLNGLPIISGGRCRDLSKSSSVVTPPITSRTRALLPAVTVILVDKRNGND